MVDSWKFDQSVAQTFARHAEQHIPHYRSVLEKSLMACQKFANLDDAIVDIGCATGETLKLLHQAGFCNLFGIDSSKNMLDQCPTDIATMCCSDQLNWPPNFFQVILCNWTLHFVPNKQQYLHSMVKCLAPGGVMIISDKHTLDPTMIEFYHEFKRKQGVSQEEIDIKEQRVEGIMYVDDPNWYQQQFDLLKLHHRIIDADWAFISFMVQKPI